jgi:hypothetical protein
MARIITRNVRGVGRIVLSQEEREQLHVVKGTYVFLRFNGRGYLDILAITTMSPGFELFPTVQKKEKR